MCVEYFIVVVINFVVVYVGSLVDDLVGAIGNIAMLEVSTVFVT